MLRAASRQPGVADKWVRALADAGANVRDAACMLNEQNAQRVLRSVHTLPAQRLPSRLSEGDAARRNLTHAASIRGKTRSSGGDLDLSYMSPLGDFATRTASDESMVTEPQSCSDVLGGEGPSAAAQQAGDAERLAARGYPPGETSEGHAELTSAPEEAPTTPPHRGPMFGSTPVHSCIRYSYLSSERMWHEKHTGLYNLAGVLLLATHFRLALENMLKYGWRYNPLRRVQEIISGGGNVPVALCFPALLLMAGMSLMSEKLGLVLLERQMQLRDLLAKKELLDTPAGQARLTAMMYTHEWILFAINVVITTAVLIVPWATIFITLADAPVGFALMLTAIVMWMKLVSYHHCCWDLRRARRDGRLCAGERGSPDTPLEWGILAYPENLTAASMGYFLLAPTLCYQVNYPRSRSIRKPWLLRRVAELVLVITVLTFIVHQYVEPTVNNSIRPLQDMDWVRVMERVAKLAIPSTYTWLAGSYAAFHLWLNILAELLRFGDREFYKDWWNAATLAEYWRLWNMPVHKWLLRHVYSPAIRYQAPKLWAMVLVFFVSAVFHELIMGVPLHMVRLWAFTGIMMQIPLIFLTEMLRKRLRRQEWGNIIFWVTFCMVGQPITMLMYYHDYVLQVQPAILAMKAATVLPH